MVDTGWLRGLCDLVLTWSRDPSNRPMSPATQAYIQLIFAYGLARAGDNGTSNQLLDAASQVLAARDAVHQSLLKAYDYRIKMAQEGHQSAGPLPAEVVRFVEKDRANEYLVDRLRQHSRILEPERQIDPYRGWSAKPGSLEKDLSDLSDLTDCNEIVERTNRLLHTHASKGNKGLDAQVSILSTVLNLALRFSEGFALDRLTQLLPAYDKLPEVKDATVLEQQARLLEKGLFVAGHFGSKDHMRALIARFAQLLQSQRGNAADIQILDSLVEQSVHGLRKLGMREELDTFLRQTANAILDGRDLTSIKVKRDRRGTVMLQALLPVAGGWLYLGREQEAEPILNAVRDLLFKNELYPREQTPLARAYAFAVGQAPPEAARTRLEELFHRLQGIQDTFTTNTHYSLLQLEVVEGVILGLVDAG